MEILNAILFLIILIVLSFSLSSVAVTFKDFKYYKKVYDSLGNKKFYINHNQVYNHAYGDIDNGFVWFLEDNSFQLSHGAYLHNALYTYFSPYSCYWLLKYRKWFKENVNIDTIEKY